MFDQMMVHFKALGEAGLFINSFVESFFLVPPPDFLLIAMDLAKPEKAFWFATICTIASSLGGAVGYFIGKFGGRPAFMWLFNRGKKNKTVKKEVECETVVEISAPEKSKGEKLFEQVETLYNEHGPMCVFMAAFTPIPYKVFTIASGILNMNFPAFMLASVIGRGGRFFLVSTALFFFGALVKQYLEWVIIVVSVIILVFFWILYKKRHSIVKKSS